MTIIIGREGILGEPLEEIARLESLSADLIRIADGWMPSPHELASTPLIDNFMIGTRVQPCLMGHVFDHPLLGSRRVVTSGLWAIAPELGWARTYSRFYKLGCPFGVRRDG